MELAKQAALADSHFRETVKDLKAARKEAADNVALYRSQFASDLAKVTSTIKLVETELDMNVAKVSAEVQDMKAAQYAVNAAVTAELDRVEELSNSRFTKSKEARGQLRRLMDENKAAAAAEVHKLKEDLEAENAKLRATNAHNKREMAKDLTEASEQYYEALAKQAKAHGDATDALNAETQAAQEISANNLNTAKKNFHSKIVMLTNNVQANHKVAVDNLAKLTGHVNDYAEAAAADRGLLEAETTIMHNDLNKALKVAISKGEARAKAVEQRIAS